MSSHVKGKVVGAVASAALILRVLRDSPFPLNGNQVAKAAGLYRGTAYNLLWTLVREKLVHFDIVSKRFSLSIEWLSFAHNVLRKSGLMNVVRPMLFDIAEKYRAGCYLSKVTENLDLLIIDSVGPGVRDDIYSSVGRLNPGFAGAPGLIMAAYLPFSDSEIQEKYDASMWDSAPPLFQFLREKDDVKSTGVAVDRGRRWQRLTQVSAPVFDVDGNLCLIMTIAAYSDHIDVQIIQELKTEARIVADRISSSMHVLNLG